MKTALAAGFILACAAATGAAAQGVEKGRALAQSLCAACHLQPGQGEKHGPNGLPGFQAIADRPGQSHEAIVKWLRSGAPVMPDHHLTWDEADALADFIMSMRKAK